MEKKQHLAQLIQAYLEGTATRAEVDVLLQYFQLPEESDELVRLMTEVFHQPVPDSVDAEQVAAINRRVGDRLSRQILPAASSGPSELSGSPRRKRRMLIRLLPYAAAVIVAAVVAWITWGERVPGTADQKIVDAKAILPGGNKATLVLPDGRTVLLDAVQDGIVVDDHRIAYADGTGESITQLDGTAAEQLTLTTPRGGVYAVTLPDGSRVWLNTSSTLKYPSRFAKDQRRVEIEGEAYFEVAHRPECPFVVKSREQEVEVLGTQFNICAYPDESKSKTTLVEGKVRIVNSLSSDVRSLAPGEQAIVRGGQTDIQTVDVSQFTAWKEGFFYFDGLDPQIAFDQMERWYDIEVRYQGQVPSTRFFGMIDRSGTLHDALVILKESGLRCRLVRSKGVTELQVLGE